MVIPLDQHSFISGSQLNCERDSGGEFVRLSVTPPIIHITAIKEAWRFSNLLMTD